MIPTRPGSKFETLLMVERSAKCFVARLFIGETEIDSRVLARATNRAEADALAADWAGKVSDLEVAGALQAKAESLAAMQIRTAEKLATVLTLLRAGS